MLANRLRRNLARLGPWARREGLEAWRLYDRDIPEYPWTIDRYGDRALVTEIESAASRRMTPPERAKEVDTVVLAAAEELGLSRDRIALRSRARHRSVERQAAGDPRHEFPVAEGDSRFLVNLDDYLDTGLFLDQRESRVRLRKRSAGARVLNLFSYTGAFTVAAARGGAARIVSVDLSATYLAWAERNLRLNAHDRAGHTFVREDVFAFLGTGSERFDLIVLDPPTVSRSARGRSFEVQSAHVELIRRSIARLEPPGTLFFSTNDRGFELGTSALKGLAIDDVTEATHGRDFREPAHRAWELRPHGST
jgi:23S rRNA (cytosine1962-C5)-methyltransferase